MFEVVVGECPAVLAPALADLDPGAVSDAVLVDAIVAAERLASFATARQAELIAELAARRIAEDPDGGEFVGDEIGAALRISRVTANGRLGFALDLARLPGTTAALRSGVIDVPRAQAVADATACLPDELGRAVETEVLPAAGEQTAAQLRASLRRAMLSADPAAAERRHQQQVALRRVELRPLPDGMAELCALLPADQAVAVYTTLDRYARRARQDRRLGVDARRADALVALVTGAAATGTAVAATTTLGAAGASTCGGPGPRPPRALVHVTVPATTLLGAPDEPGELAGYGPIPAGLARLLAAGGTWRRLLTDPRSGALVELGRTTYVPPAALADQVRARDVTCRFPGCRRPAIGCDLDHTRRHPDGPTCPCNLAALCRHHHRLKHLTGWTVVQDEHGVLTWTSPTGHIYRTYPPPRGQPEQWAPLEQTAGAEQPAPVDQPTTPEEPPLAEADQQTAEQPATEQPATEQSSRGDHDTAA